MPELPEVEIVARALEGAIGGRRIVSAELRRTRLAPDTTPARFASQLGGAGINRIHRRGKNILFDLDNGRTLLTHLRMSGRFRLISEDDEEPKFTHAVFDLDRGSRLVFEDQRHFGLMKVISTSRLLRDPAIAKLAPEPFSEEFSVSYLAKVLSASSRNLKEFLLDQTKVCGLGNIYASEAMFYAGLSPRRWARNVRRTRVDRLFASIRNVLDEALTVCGSKRPNPVIIGEGVYGDGITAEWAVYEREGMPCMKCQTPIRRIRQGARSTYYCPRCQC